MVNLIGQWIGNSYGTHPANIFVEFSLNNSDLIASIRVAMPGDVNVIAFVGNSHNKMG